MAAAESSQTALLRGYANSLRSGAAIQCLQYSADMHSNSAMAQSQCAGDLFIGLALADQAQHFDLSHRQSKRRSARRARREELLDLIQDDRPLRIAFERLMARRSLQLVAPRLRLKELPVEHLKWRRAVGVIYRKDSSLSPAARRLIHLLRTMAPE